MIYNGKNYKVIVDTADGRKVCVEQWNEHHADGYIGVLTHTYLVEDNGDLVRKPWVNNPYQTQLTVTPGSVKKGWPGDVLEVPVEPAYESLADASAHAADIISLAITNNLFD